jgi:actin-related protein 7
MATPIGDNVVVIDHDDDFLRAGYCIPERDPQVVLPTAVRKPGAGSEILRPIARRRVRDWDQLEALYAHAFYRQLGWVEGDEGAVLVSEPLFTSRADRERMAQTMFESFNVSGLYIAEQPVLALYGVGKTSGVSVDVGYAVTDVAPVMDGAVVTTAARRCDVGSRDVTAALHDALGENHSNVSEAELDAVRDAACIVSPSANAHDEDATAPSLSHTLPDGNRIEVPGAARTRCAEATVRPSRFAVVAGDAISGGGCPPWVRETVANEGVSDALAAAVHACTAEQRLACLDAVAVSGAWAGGAGRRAGFETRVLLDLEDALPPSARPMSAGIPEHMPESVGRHAAWFGGALLGKVVFAQNHHVTKFEYQENGPGRVIKRF